MIILGTTGLTFTKEDHHFHCPGCGSKAQGKRKVVRRFFTVYFIPLIPLDTIQEYIQCDHCRGNFQMEILEYDPSRELGKFCEDLKRVMVMIMIADGTIDDREVATIQRIYADVSGNELTRDEIGDDVELAQRAGTQAVDYARRIVSTLNDEQKALLVRSSFLVASAGGDLRPEQSRQLRQLGAALGIPDDEYRAIIEDALAGDE